jgi:hypothetical protein
MVTHIDEKGKIYTNIIQKQAIWVTLQLANARVHGLIYIRGNERIKETLDEAEPFLALTQAEIFSADGTISQLKTNFLAVNKAQILWLLPDIELVGKE